MNLDNIRPELRDFLLLQDRGIQMLRRQHQYIAYLAQPYSHTSECMRKVRYHHAVLATTWLLGCGIPVYSPIVHCHPLALSTINGGHDYNKGSDAHIWARLNRAHITRSAEFIILELAGWRDSVGLMGDDETEGEMQYAESIQIPVTKLPAIYPTDLDDLE